MRARAGGWGLVRGTPGLVNIIARVTGNTPSRIDGFLSAPANLFLLKVWVVN